MNRTKIKWFRENCAKASLNTQQITLFGDYAVNADGDFLYSARQENGTLKFCYIANCDLVECEEDYAMWLASLIDNIEEGYKDPYSDEILVHRTYVDRVQIAHAFKECICRSEQLTHEYRQKLRDSDTMMVVTPSIGPKQFSAPGEVRCIHGMVNVDDTAEYVDENGFPHELVEMNPSYANMGGYRYALKPLMLDAFVEMFGNILYPGQRKPFDILADLERQMDESYRKYGRLQVDYLVKQSDDDYVEFSFSHFEMENEPDTRFRTFFACYTLKLDI